MIRKDKHKFANGTYKTQVRICLSYRDDNGRPKMKTLEDFGYLEDKPDQEAFLKMLVERNKELIKEKRVYISKTPKKPFYEEEGSTASNFGYKYLEVIFDGLELNKVFNNLDFKGEYSLTEMLKFLVIQRILKPCSKTKTYQNYLNLYGKKVNFSLDQLYRSLSIFSEYSDEIQKHLNDKIKELIGRNTSEVFYNSTNYLFQKDFEDEVEF